MQHEHLSKEVQRSLVLLHVRTVLHQGAQLVELRFGEADPLTLILKHSVDLAEIALVRDGALLRGHVLWGVLEHGLLLQDELLEWDGEALGQGSLVMEFQYN
jgi:hypothetical protein